MQKPWQQPWKPASDSESRGIHTYIHRRSSLYRRSDIWPRLNRRLGNGSAMRPSAPPAPWSAVVPQSAPPPQAAVPYSRTFIHNVGDRRRYAPSYGGDHQRHLSDNVAIASGTANFASGVARGYRGSRRARHALEDKPRRNMQPNPFRTPIDSSRTPFMNLGQSQHSYAGPVVEDI